MEQNTLIATPLPIAYRQKNEIIVKDGLDLNLKDEVWGIKLPNGVIISVKFTPISWLESNALATQTLMHNGKFGHLPSRDNFEWQERKSDLNLFRDTLRILQQHHVKADICGDNCGEGIVWLGDICNYEFSAYSICLDDYDIDFFGIAAKCPYDRIGVIFD